MKYFYFVLLLISLISTSCSLPLFQNMKGPSTAQKETAQLNSQIQALQKKQYDLSTQETVNTSKIETISNHVSEMQKELLELRQLVNQLQETDKKETPDIQNQLYKEAYGDFSASKYDLAYSEFHTFIIKYPKSNLASTAQFYMGECFFVRKMWQKAITEFEKVTKLYPRSNAAVSAMFKLGLCYEQMGKKKEAMSMFSSIIKNFPQSPESVSAKEKIKANNNAK
jgi:tol-pal system protein YbgF